MPTTHPDNLWQRASARWAEIGAISPDLAPAVALQQRLLRLILDAAEKLDQRLPSSLTATSVVDKWRRGLPALRNEHVPIPDSLKDVLPSFCSALADGGAGDSALHIRDALLHGHIDAGSLLSVSLARNQKAIRTSALHMGFSPDLVWLVGELGSSPLAHHLQTQLLGSDPRTLQTRLLGSDPRTDKGVRPQSGRAIAADAHPIGAGRATLSLRVPHRVKDARARAFEGAIRAAQVGQLGRQRVLDVHVLAAAAFQQQLHFDLVLLPPIEVNDGRARPEVVTGVFARNGIDGIGAHLAELSGFSHGLADLLPHPDVIAAARHVHLVFTMRSTTLSNNAGSIRAV